MLIVSYTASEKFAGFCSYSHTLYQYNHAQSTQAAIYRVMIEDAVRLTAVESLPQSELVFIDRTLDFALGQYFSTMVGCCGYQEIIVILVVRSESYPAPPLYLLTSHRGAHRNWPLQ
jgi:hypothetical protein